MCVLAGSVEVRGDGGVAAQRVSSEPRLVLAQHRFVERRDRQDSAVNIQRRLEPVQVGD
jgi:hypothetical protein